MAKRLSLDAILIFIQCDGTASRYSVDKFQSNFPQQGREKAFMAKV
jgi:hypothetical protein